MARTIVRVNGGVRLCIDAQVPIPICAEMQGKPDPEPEVVCIFAQVEARWGWGRGALFPPLPIPGFS